MTKKEHDSLQELLKGIKNNEYPISKKWFEEKYKEVIKKAFGRDMFDVYRDVFKNKLSANQLVESSLMSLEIKKKQKKNLRILENRINTTSRFFCARDFCIPVLYHPGRKKTCLYELCLGQIKVIRSELSYISETSETLLEELLRMWEVAQKAHLNTAFRHYVFAELKKRIIPILKDVEIV